MTSTDQQGTALRCPSCRTAALVSGRKTCQACAALVLYRSRVREPRSWPAVPSPRAGQPCAQCGAAASGPGGILCPECKVKIEANGRALAGSSGSGAR